MQTTNESLSEGESSSGPGRSGWPAWLAPLLIALLVFAAFFPALAQKDFLDLQEKPLLIQNARHRGLGLDNIGWAFDPESSVVDRQYHPLVWISFGVDWLVWRDDARGYVLTNVVLHALSGIFLYLIAGRLFTAARKGRPEAPAPGETGVRLGALLAALLFAVHPLRAESVAWLVERRDVLCGFFFLASILCYLRCRDLTLPLADEDPSSHKPGWPRLWMIVSVVLALAAVLSKATAVCLPLVLVVLDIYPLRESARRIKGLWWDRAPYFVVAAIGSLTALPALGEGTYPGPESWPARAAVALHGSLILLFKMVWPVGLGPIYAPPAEVAWATNANVVIGAVAGVVVTVVLLLLRRRWPAGLVTWLCYLVMLLPVSGLVRIGVPVEADRHSYLAGMSWAALLGAGLWVLCRRRAGGGGVGSWGRVVVVVGALVVLLLTGLTFVQSRTWRDDKSFWLRVEQAQPDNWLVCANLGRISRHEGDLQGAVGHYRRTIELKPDAWEAHNNLGQILSLTGGLKGVAEALEHFRLAKEINPASPAPRQNIVANLFILGRMDEAEAELQELLSLLPDEAPDAVALKRVRARALNDLGAVYNQQGRYDEAIERYRQCLSLVPIFGSAHQGLGDAWLAKGELGQAMAHLEEALRLNPNDELVRAKLVDLRGRRAGTASQPVGGAAPGAQAAEEVRKQIPQALARLREVLEKDPEDAMAHYELGVLLAQVGHLEQCIHHCRQAIRLKPELSGACYQLVAVLMRTNRTADAVAAARAGLVQTPEETRLLGALAFMLAASSDPEIADAGEALKLAERANQLETDNPSLMEVLAVAYAANGRLDETIETLAKARALAETQGQTLMVERLSRRLEAYEQGRAAGASP